MKESKYDRCKYPSCEGNVTRNPQIGLCNRHSDMLEFVIWVLDNIRIKEPETPKLDGSTLKIK